MSLDRTAKNIRTLRIQGAQNVARAAVHTLYDACKKGHGEHAYAVLVQTRSTEPCMRNALSYVLRANAAGRLDEGYLAVLDHFDRSEQRIAAFIAMLMKDNMTVYTHCHSGTVVRGLLLAKAQGKQFSVCNTETRPLFQGRKTAGDLAKAGIPVEHFVDGAMKLAIKKTQLVLLGADAITAQGDVYNKIGSELACIVARQYRIPVYICSDSWKFDSLTTFGFEEMIEQRHAREVWPRAPKGVTISNLAFEKINALYIRGIITELGMIAPKDVGVIVRHYPWMTSAASPKPLSGR